MNVRTMHNMKTLVWMYVRGVGTTRIWQPILSFQIVPNDFLL